MLFKVLFLGVVAKICPGQVPVGDTFSIFWLSCFNILFQIFHVITNIVPAFKDILWCILHFFESSRFPALNNKIQAF